MPSRAVVVYWHLLGGCVDTEYEQEKMLPSLVLTSSYYRELWFTSILSASQFIFGK